jgi:hypothetical protein
MLLLAACDMKQDMELARLGIWPPEALKRLSGSWITTAEQLVAIRRNVVPRRADRAFLAAPRAIRQSHAPGIACINSGAIVEARRYVAVWNGGKPALQ